MIDLWQSSSLHLLSAPVKVSDVAAGQDALQGALEGPAVLPGAPSPVEDVRAGSARQQQVQ